MGSNRRRNANRLAKQVSDLGLAVPEVIAHRLARLSLAGASPSPRDRAEFQRMSTEKVSAFYESWNAMLAATYRANLDFTMSFLAWPTSWAGWNRTVRASAQRAALDVLASGVAPVHRRAVANAKRLRRRRSSID
jgi:hypothetical protein